MNTILTKLKRWLRPRLPEGEQYVDETAEGELYESMIKSCPSCHQPSDWMIGPDGGVSVNVFCGHCGQGYNITPILRVAQEIHKDKRYILE